MALGLWEQLRVWFVDRLQPEVRREGIRLKRLLEHTTTLRQHANRLPQAKVST